MHRLLDYMDKIVGDKEKEQELRGIVDCFFEKVRHENPELYYGAMLKIHVLAYGRHFDPETAEMAVARMRNADGTHGGKWPMADTDRLAEQHGVKCKADFHYVMNMMYSDYCGVLGADPTTHANMAKAYIEDPDAQEGKAFCAWVHQMQAETE